MATPGKMKEVDVAEVLRLLNEKGSMPKVARELDMSDSGLFLFLKRHGIEKKPSEWYVKAG